MGTEKEKMLAGELYRPTDEQLVNDRHEAKVLFREFNISKENQIEVRAQLLQKLFRAPHEIPHIEPPFYCDYGYNIHFGRNVFLNYNCCILDVCQVIIGDNAMFGPNVQIYTATHPLEHELRNSGVEYAKTISIGHNVWIGGNAVICPGVSIGNNVVIGAGSVVTKNFPDNVCIAGNPAKIIKTINNG